MPREQPRLNSANPLSDITQLSSQHVEHFASDVRQVGPSRAERSDEPLNVAHIATNNNAELGTMSLDRTDETAALPDQKVSGSVKEKIDCCSEVLIGTNRMDGRCTASQIASASAASFFWLFTYGFTNCGGINQSCPSALISRAQ